MEGKIEYKKAGDDKIRRLSDHVSLIIYWSIGMYTYLTATSCNKRNLQVNFAAEFL
jgi:hypothetical protein